jgi:hypothetical protein
MDDLHRTDGNFEAKIDRLERDVATLIKHQNEMLQILHQAKGGWKVMVMVGGAASAITVFFYKILSYFWVMPR